MRFCSCELLLSWSGQCWVFPLGNVVVTAIAVVLQADDGHEVHVREFGVQGFYFFVECHYAALTSAPDIDTNKPVQLIVPVALVEYKYSSI